MTVPISRFPVPALDDLPEDIRSRLVAVHPVRARQEHVRNEAGLLMPRQRAMLDFAVKVAERSHEVGEDDFAMLRKHAMSDDDIWDIGAIAALFALSNRMANMLALRPNDEFYTMGRM